MKTPEAEAIATPVAPRAKRNPLARWGLRMAAAIVVALGTAEGGARWGLGLGDPPLIVADADDNYRFKPDQSVLRFGNVIRYNHYSQRAEAYPPTKQSADEYRVLMIRLVQVSLQD